MISMFDYRAGLNGLKPELHSALERVLESNCLVLGEETERFENEFAEWVGAKHCVAVSSGTVALFAALKCKGVGSGDEVITVSNTCVPTIAAIRQTGATPVFVDVCSDTLMLDVSQVESVITKETKAILPVHLWGNAVDLAPLRSISQRNSLALIEDCAQSTGTRYRGRHVGVEGAAGCFSFYPTKNLGAYGDGGAVITNDSDFADRLRRFRMYGCDKQGIAVEEGVNARINELQAAFLRVKLRRLDSCIERRRGAAEIYSRQLVSDSNIAIADDVDHSYHQFVIRTRRRSDVIYELDAAEIGWGIHYRMPVHKMSAYRNYSRSLPVTEEAATQILSLPVHEHLTHDEIRKVARIVGHALGASSHA